MWGVPTLYFSLFLPRISISCVLHTAWPWGAAFPSFWGCASYSYKYSPLLALSGSLVDIFVFTVGGSLRSCSYSAPCQGCFSPSLPKLTPALWPKQLNILKAPARPSYSPSPISLKQLCCMLENRPRTDKRKQSWTDDNDLDQIAILCSQPDSPG